ncbi:MAG: 3-deoxy-8-phosphooctulonate synthase [Phycisphaerae bacterium]|nr:3-deoxy-8-phosphooctulonate synthase [Phycisphaerae bacterium]
MRVRSVTIADIHVGPGHPLVFIAGPCVIESHRACLSLAGRLADLAERLSVPLIFKASFDKANRTSLQSFRGPGLERGLETLAAVRARYGLPLLTDVHTEDQVSSASMVVDVLQIPAFLCRQTDLLLAAAATNCAVNVKKGQFLAPEDMRHVAEKIAHSGNRRILLTERGSSFGYHQLVADLRSLPIMRGLGYPVVFDATHSVQRPGAGAGRSGGDGRLAPALARAAVAVGCDAVFMETHANPVKALSDAENAVSVRHLEALWRKLVEIHELVA